LKKLESLRRSLGKGKRQTGTGYRVLGTGEKMNSRILKHIIISIICLIVIFILCYSDGKVDNYSSDYCSMNGGMSAPFSYSYFIGPPTIEIEHIYQRKFINNKIQIGYHFSRADSNVCESDAYTYVHVYIPMLLILVMALFIGIVNIVKLIKDILAHRNQNST
jgi:hypothetical protein